MRIIGSTWTGKYTSGKTTYQRKFSAFAEYEVTETPTTITYTISELGIQKVGGGTAQMVTGETKSVSFQIVEGTTVLGSVGVTGYTQLMKFESADPYPISITNGSFTINKTASDRAVKLVLSASKDAGAWNGTSTLEEEVTIPAWSKPTVQFTVTRSETTATNASVTATVTSFVGDTISNFTLSYGSKTTTLTGGTIPASGTITRTTTISGLATGAVECSLVATGTGGTSATVTRVIPSAFYTLEIGEEGKEIAFGASATGDTVPSNGLFKCMMDVMFKHGLLADYVVETGTDGYWNYEKWASGKAVAWGKYDISGYSWVNWGSYGSETSNTDIQNPPTGLFVDNPMVIPKIWDESGALGLLEETWQYNNGSFRVRGVRFRSGTSATNKLTVHVVLRGKWK